MWPYAALVGALLLFGGYLAMVLRGDGALEQPPEQVRERMARERTQALRRRLSGEAKPAGSKKVQRPPPAGGRPRIRPAVGTVGSASAAPGVSARDGLLDALADGPDYRRRSAARGLSVPFAGTRDPRVVAALADAVRNEEFGFTVRAEAYCAMRAVMGQHLEWKDEVEVRRGFPDGADFEWVEAAEQDACATPEGEVPSGAVPGGTEEA